MSDRAQSQGPTQPVQLAAGALGMIFFIAALTMFFGAGIVVYLIMRQMHQPWPPNGFPALPPSLWLSTLDIVLASVSIHGAVLAAGRGDKAGLQRTLVAALVLGLAFLGLQSYAWYRIWTQVAAVTIAGSSSYLKMFYALTGLHAIHVGGGLVPLAMLTAAAYRDAAVRTGNAAVRYTAVYWHFLDVVWCIVFGVVYLL
jgi:cytochrome c oxidase subunit 3